MTGIHRRLGFVLLAVSLCGCDSSTMVTLPGFQPATLDPLSRGPEWSEPRSTGTYRLVSNMTCEEAIKFCRSAKIKSQEWVGAIAALDGFNERDLVVPYLLELVAHEDKEVRYHCYKVALSGKMPDLAGAALKDIDDGTVIPTLNSQVDELTLGSMARKYLRSTSFHDLIPDGNKNPYQFISPAF